MSDPLQIKLGIDPPTRAWHHWDKKQSCNRVYFRDQTQLNTQAHGLGATQDLT